MKILSVVSAKSLWFFDPRELNPRGKSIYPELIDWLREEYDFEEVPKSQTDANPQGGLEFKRGCFEVDAKTNEFINVDLTLFTDGALADTRSSTKDSDAFLERTLKSVAEVFGLEHDPSLIRKKGHISEVSYRSDRSLSALNPRLEQFCSRLSDLSKRPIQTIALMFGRDPREAMMPAPTLPPFSFERLANSPFSENRYYSKAPIDTETHFKLLEEFEEILAGEQPLRL